MKNKNLLLLLLILSLSQIFVSCGSYINLDFANRKHIRKLSEEKNLGNTSLSKIDFKEIKKLENVILENKCVEENFTESKMITEQNNFVASTKSTPVYYKKNLSNPLQANNLLRQKRNEINLTDNPNKNNIIQKEKEVFLKHPTPTDDRLILEVILAIFIPPIAVYMHQMEHITNLFWIDLILCLLSILGVGFTPFFGLWLVAIVIALLVVFDVIH